MGNLRIHLRQSINTLIYSVIVDKLSSNVENWEAIIHKIVTSKNGNLVGNVDAVDDSSCTGFYRRWSYSLQNPKTHCRGI